MNLKSIVDLVEEQEKNEELWKDRGKLKDALQQLHILIKETIDLGKLKRTFSRFYGDDMIPLKVHNSVFAEVEVELLDPLASPGSKEFQDKLFESVQRNGLKDPFTIHYVTNVPIKNRHGYLIKTGNNRYHTCKALGIKKVPCVVINLSGECFGSGMWNEPFVAGEILRNEADVRKHFHTPRVNIVWRDGMIVNAYTPYFLRIHSDYDKEKVITG